MNRNITGKKSGSGTHTDPEERIQWSVGHVLGHDHDRVACTQRKHHSVTSPSTWHQTDQYPSRSVTNSSQNHQSESFHTKGWTQTNKSIPRLCSTTSIRKQQQQQTNNNKRKTKNKNTKEKQNKQTNKKTRQAKCQSECTSKPVKDIHTNWTPPSLMLVIIVTALVEAQADVMNGKSCLEKVSGRCETKQQHSSTPHWTSCCW